MEYATGGKMFVIRARGICVSGIPDPIIDSATFANKIVLTKHYCDFIVA
jgi:hypothetical protein